MLQKSLLDAATAMDRRWRVKEKMRVVGLATFAVVAVSVSLGSMNGAGLWMRRQVCLFTLHPLALAGPKPGRLEMEMSK